MFSNQPNPEIMAAAVATHFGGNQHGSHGRRIDREDVRQQQLEIVDLEYDQKLQDEVLTLYHLSTIAFEMGPAAKLVISSNGRFWIKNFQMEVTVS